MSDPIILNGKAYADEICTDLKKRVDNLHDCNIKPELIIVTASTDPASKIYVRNKIKRCNEIGIEVEHIVVESLTKETMEYAAKRNVPCIVQLPCNFADGLSVKSLSAYISAENDVDAFVSPLNVSALVAKQNPYNYPCTPRGIVDLLKHYGIEISGKNVCVIGRSEIVGMPVSIMLNNENATVTICHSKTNELDKYEYVYHADIIVSATGHLNTLDWNKMQEYGFDDEIMKDKIIVDVGTNRLNGHLVGDIPQEIKDKCKMYTPSIGGVGPMTVIELCKAVVERYEKNCGGTI